MELDTMFLKKTPPHSLEAERKVHQSLAEKLSQVSLTFTRRAGDKDVIFGSVSSGDVKDALDALGYDIDKKKILLDEPIKRLGNFTVPVKVSSEDRAEVKIVVAREEAEGEAAGAAVEPGENEASGKS